MHQLASTDPVGSAIGHRTDPPGGDRAAGAPEHAAENPEKWSKILGAARYTADLAADARHVAFLRSPHASARITGIDTARAERMPGVARVVTAADIRDAIAPIGPPARNRPQPTFSGFFGLHANARSVPVLADHEVRYVGEPIVAVVADSRYRAEDALEAIDVDYEVRRAYLDPTGPAAGRTPVHADVPDNLAVDLRMAKGRIPEAIDPITVEGTFRIGRQTAAPLEGRAVKVVLEPSGSVTVWSATQVPFVLRASICASLGWAPESVRIRTARIGGAFGSKACVYPEEVLLPWLARELGEDVIWVEDRYENFVSASQARDQVHHARLVIDRDGTILSWTDDFVVDIGVHNSSMVGVVANTAIHALGPYRIPHVDIRGRAMFTNKSPTIQYRGAGRPEATFALERIIDKAADRLGIPPTKIRAANLLTTGDLPYAEDVPYRDGVSIVLDGADYLRVYHRALDMITEEEIARLKQTVGRDRRVGYGTAAFIEATGRGPAEPETARITLRPDGSYLIATGTSASGQFHERAFARIFGDGAQVVLDKVTVVSGDTDAVSQGFGTFASRSTVVAGSAVHHAARAMIAAIRSLAEEVLGEQEMEVTGEHIRLVDTGETVPVTELLDRLPPDRRTLSVEETYAPATVTWTMGVHAVVAAVDVYTGSVEVLRYCVAHESGNFVDEANIDGQIRGGVAQAIGGAILESLDYDGDGQNVTPSFADYHIPTASDVPQVTIAHFEVPSELNPLGARGIGESGVIGGGAAIAAAVEDALAEFSVVIDRTPITPAYLRSLIGGVRDEAS